MLKRDNGINTICTHTGSVDDTVYGGATSPIYLSTSYSFVDNITNRYPRYFNTPNQEFLAKKVAEKMKILILNFTCFRSKRCGWIWGSGSPNWVRILVRVYG